MDLDAKVIAVVGPNEAGKSSLLHALAFLENREPLTHRDRTRETSIEDDATVVEVRFALSESDRRIRELYGIGSPRWYVFSKKANGTIAHRVEPEVTRDLSYRTQFLDRISRSLKNTRITKLLQEVLVDFSSIDVEQVSENGLDSEATIYKSLDWLRGQIDTERETLGKDILNHASAIRETIDDLVESSTQSQLSSLQVLLSDFELFLKAEFSDNPRIVFLKECSKDRPTFVLFDDAARNLRSAYSISDLEDPPGALYNLFSLAQIDIDRLRAAIENEDQGAIHAMQESGNHHLRHKFETFWSQSEIFPSLRIGDDAIHILVRLPTGYSDIAERSDGLRSFVALSSFVALKLERRRAILLVDEAETHLHYAAQSDLVRMFESQEIVDGIIYTTHSAGCLPSDLGTGIRVARPLIDASGSDLGTSEINNSFWTEGSGFSPLLLAMGAGVIAFTLARRAIIAEGASDTILLPRILREASGRSFLQFQVAPGIASVSVDKARELELEAGKVVFLVDGDEGGKSNRKKLIAAGIDRKAIVSLPNHITCEDFVDDAVFIDAVNKELERSHGIRYNPKRLPAKARLKHLKAWCTANEIQPPRKVKIAQHIVSVPTESVILRTARRRDALRLYHALLDMLDIAQT